MAETITSQISFSKLIAHTFPGMFVALGIFMVIYVKISDRITNAFLLKLISDNWTIFLSAFGGLIFFGTLIGIVIDSIHHVIIEGLIINEIINKKIDYAQKKITEINKKKNDVYKDAEGREVGWFYYLCYIPIDKLNYLDENYYSYKECNLNLSVSFFFSSFIYAFFIHKIGYDTSTVIFVFLVFLLLSGLCFYFGLHFYFRFRTNIIDFVKGATERTIR